MKLWGQYTMPATEKELEQRLSILEDALQYLSQHNQRLIRLENKIKSLESWKEEVQKRFPELKN